MPRFYLPIATEVLQQSLLQNQRLALTPEAAHHAGRALRLRTGEQVTLFNGEGSEWKGTIEFDRQGAFVVLETENTPQREASIDITLIQALVAPEKLDWIVEKAVELGVKHLCLCPSARSVTRLTSERALKRLQKCQSIAISASEQCGRNVLMQLSFIPSLEEALTQTKADQRLLLAPAAAPAENPFHLTKSVAVAVGPEGGFSPEEISLATELGWQAQLLGPRVMRTETAGLAAAVWLQTLAGDLP